MDATNDPLPHPKVSDEPHVPDAMGKHGREELSIWFFCGMLMLAYGIVLVAQGLFERFGLFGQQQPDTVLANLQPTLWWGFCLFVFGAFYTIRFRPGKR